jgi:uncharacterized membrane protein YidH (DUF202 family)
MSSAAAERTRLAWQRSAFAFATLAGVALAIAAHRNAPGLLALSAALLGLAAAVWRGPRAPALVTAGTVLAAIGCALAVTLVE